MDERAQSDTREQTGHIEINKAQKDWLPLARVYDGLGPQLVEGARTESDLPLDGQIISPASCCR
jgi:hypothetical protein